MEVLVKNSELKTIDLANELKRLASNVARDIRRESELSCLSNLTAMRPLTQMLFEFLTADLSVDSPESEATKDDEKNPIGFSK
jgi:hypothetical protein